MAQWIWPCPGNETITSGVGARWGTTHKGIDISASKGSDVVASRGGKVIQASSTCTHNYGKDKSCGCGGGYGNYIYVDSGDGYVTRYAHLTDVNVKVGDTVSQGDVIGTVGSTGHSTGNHLHFEIRNNNNYLDPEKYVNPSNTIVNNTASNNPSTSTSKNSNNNKSTSGDKVTADNKVVASDLTVDARGITGILPVMSRDFTGGEPVYPYVRIKVGDKELKYEHGKPSIIQRFEMDRLLWEGSKLNLVLFDDNWMDIETYLSANYRNIRVQYGYSSGAASPGVSSPEYRLILEDYNIEFHNTGVILSINAITTGVVDNLQSKEFDTGTQRPSEAIRKICNYMGWEIDESDFATTNVVNRSDGNYVLRKEYPLTYIETVIIPEAQSETSSFYFYLDAQNKAHLRRVAYSDNGENLPTYVYLKGYDGVIEDLSIKLNGVFGGATDFNPVTRVDSTVIDQNTKEENSVEVDTETVTKDATGEYSWTSKDNSNAKVLPSGESIDQMRNKLYYSMTRAANKAATGNMTIVGDPNIKVLDTIRILIPTDKVGELHHLSGVYMVTGVVDTIEGGKFSTTLKLQNNGEWEGGIQVMKPVVITK